MTDTPEHTADESGPELLEASITMRGTSGYGRAPETASEDAEEGDE